MKCGHTVLCPLLLSIFFSKSIFSSYFQAVTTAGAGGIQPLTSGKPAEDGKGKKPKFKALSKVSQTLRGGEVSLLLALCPQCDAVPRNH